ncbi:putative gustatory receptor 28a [Venturia canescens]|uniref:putative gustatory receptor 28a n=1 Tax=Venturia canescens TaxID=32260 RepID=UPI001C9C81B1|nr:putative gustatory receptor 28a [Venturia canescens]
MEKVESAGAKVQVPVSLVKTVSLVATPIISHEEMSNYHTSKHKRSRIFFALYYWGKLMGINIFTLTTSNDVEYSYCSVFYVLNLIVCHTYLFYHSWKERLNFLMPGETPVSVIVDFGGISSMYLEAVTAWLTNCCFKNRLSSIIKAFVQAESTSQKLNLPENYEKYFKKLIIYLVFSNTIFVSITVFVHVTLTYFSNYESGQWILFNLPRAVSIYYMTLFIWALFIVKQKFRRLNKQLCTLMQSHCIESSENVYQRPLIREPTNNSRRDSTALSDKISLISQSHRELRDLINRIVDHLALLIVFQITTQLTFLTFDVYAIYRYVKTHELTRLVDFLFVIAFGVGISIPVTLLTIGSNVCGSTLYEANNTGNILHSVYNNSDNYFDTREAARLNTLSLDLLENKARMSILGFFDLDHFFMYQVIATSTTYLVIMLQFYS